MSICWHTVVISGVLRVGLIKALRNDLCETVNWVTLHGVIFNPVLQRFVIIVKGRGTGKQNARKLIFGGETVGTNQIQVFVLFLLLPLNCSGWHS